MYRKMTDFALAGWWRTGLPGAGASLARPSSASNAARATAPNPLAARASSSRRVGRPNIAIPSGMSVEVDELFRVEQGVRQVRPWPCVVGGRPVPGGLQLHKLQARGRFIA